MYTPRFIIGNTLKIKKKNTKTHLRVISLFLWCKNRVVMVRKQEQNISAVMILSQQVMQRSLLPKRLVQFGVFFFFKLLFLLLLNGIPFDRMKKKRASSWMQRRLRAESKGNIRLRKWCLRDQVILINQTTAQALLPFLCKF